MGREDESSGETLQQIARCLAEEAGRGQLVVFAGAGVSASVGLPTWGELLQTLLDRQGIVTQERTHELIASRLKQAMGTPEFREAVSNQCRTPQDVSSPLLESLASLPVNLYLTTNYDTLLEQTLRQQGYDVCVVRQAEEVTSIRRDIKTVVKLHGDVEIPESIVIGSGDYLHYEKDRSGFVFHLQTHMAFDTVLYVGTSFRDPRLRDANKDILQLFGKSRRTAYITMPKPGATSVAESDEARAKSEDNPLKMYQVKLGDFEADCSELKQRGIQPVVFDDKKDVPAFIRKVTDEYRKNKDSPVVTGASGALYRSDYVEELRGELRSEREKACKQIVEKIRGTDAVRLGRAMARREAESLIDFMKAHESELSAELRTDAWATACDALAGQEGGTSHVAHECYEQAVKASSELDEQHPQVARLVRVHARLLFLGERTDEGIAAINELVQKNDPKAISLWLTMLTDLGTSEPARKFLQSRQPDSQWAAAALRMWVLLGDLTRAEEIHARYRAELGNSKKFMRDELDVVYASELARYAMHLCGVPVGDRGFIATVPVKAQELFEKAFALAKPVADFTGGFDVHALCEWATFVCMDSAYMSGHWSEAEKYAWRLVDAGVINEGVACTLEQVASRMKGDDIPPDRRNAFVNLHVQLKQRFPDDCWALIARAVIRSMVIGEPQQAFYELTEFPATSGGDDERLRAAGILYDLGIQLSRTAEVRDTLRAGLQSGDPFLGILDAHEYEERKEWEQAEGILQKILQSEVSPPLLAQAHLDLARMSVAQEKWDPARHHFEEAYSRVSVEHKKRLLQDLLLVNVKRQDDDATLDIVAKIEALGSADENALFVKAQVLFNRGRYYDAADILKGLVEKGEHSKRPDYAVLFANCLVFLKRIDEAMEVLRPFSSDDELFCKKALQMRAHLQLSSRGPAYAFTSMHSVKHRFWDDAALVCDYLKIAFQSGNERDGHQAMMRVQELQDANSPLLHAVSFDQVRQMMEEWYQTDDELRRRHRHAGVLREVIPAYRNTSMYLDWAFRTQEGDFDPTEPRHSDFATYATNSAAQGDIAGVDHSAVRRLSVPQDANAIVITYEALITLHRLGMLEAVAKRFEKIFYTDSLCAYWVAEKEMLHPLQTNREHASKRICEHVESGRIRVIKAPSCSVDAKSEHFQLAKDQEVPLIDSFTEFSDEEHKGAIIIGYRALCHWLRQRGLISQSDYERTREHVGEKRIDTAPDTHPNLDDASELVVEKVTLETIYSEGHDATLFERAHKRIIVAEATARWFRRISDEIDFRDQVRDWQDDLVNVKLKELASRFQPARASYDKDKIQNSGDLLIQTGGASIKLAEERKLPLLADDRVKLLIYDHAHPGMACSTAALLEDLAGREIIDQKQHADAFLQLRRWRYRFLVPTPEILQHYAREYHPTPPGSDLHELARYLHNCMRDEAVLTFFSFHHPPRFFWHGFWLLWVRTLMEFLDLVWGDKGTFNDDEASALTRWIWQECLMSAPLCGDEQTRQQWAMNAEKVLPAMIVSRAMPQEGKLEPRRVARLIGESFRALYPPSDWHNQLFNHVEGLLVKYRNMFAADETPESTKALTRATLLNLIEEHQLDMPRRISPILDELGVSFGMAKENKGTGDGQPPSATELLESLWLPDIAARAYDSDDPRNRGPIKMVQAESTLHVLVPHQYVLSEDLDDRKLALGLVLDPPDSVYPYVTSSTVEQIEKCRDALLSTDGGWERAAEEVRAAMLGDFRYIYKAPLQICAMPNESLGKTASELLIAAMRPSPATLVSEMPSICSSTTWNIETVRQNIDVSMGNKRGSSSCSVKEYLSKVGVYLLGNEFNPAMLMTQFLLPCVEPITGNGRIDDSHLCRLANEKLSGILSEVETTEDPVVVFVGLTTALNLRPYAAHEELTAPEKYREPLNTLLYDFHTDSDEARKKMLQSGWNLIQKLAAHFLRFLDVHGNTEFPHPEQRTLSAWWLAWHYRNLLSDFWAHGAASHRADAFALAAEVIEDLSYRERIEHLFYKQPAGVARHMTLFCGQSGLLASALLAACCSKAGSGGDFPQACKGLSNILDETVAYRIIELVLASAVEADPASAQAESDTLPWLWNNPPYMAGGEILDNCLGDFMGSLASEAYNNLQTARMLAKMFREEDAAQFSQWLAEGDKELTACLLSAVHRRVLFGDDLPVWFSEGLADSARLDTIANFQDGFNISCLTAIGEVMIGLYRSGKKEDAEQIANLIMGMRLAEIADDEVACLLTVKAVFACIVGGPVPLLRDCIRAFSRRQRVREALTQFSNNTLASISYVPSPRRDAVRLVLGMLRDVSGSEFPPS